MYNPSTGVDIYEMPGLPDSLPVQTFPFLRSLRKLSLVASAKDGEITVHGEPDGRMNVFSQRTGLRIAALQVDSPLSFKQTISVMLFLDDLKHVLIFFTVHRHESSKIVQFWRLGA